jgi:uncharacterized protein DUF6011
MTDFDALFAAQPAATEEPEIVDSENGQLPIAKAMKFILAGKSFFTLRSKASGTRFTYKVEQSDRPGSEHCYFVNVLVGPDNYTNYMYIGQIFTDKAVPKLVLGKPEKVKVPNDAPSVVAFVWAFNKIRFAIPHRDLEFWHAGKCGRCGLMLTDPESIRSGYGPICIDKMMGGE